MTESELYQAYRHAGALETMTEAELFAGITEALELSGWLWTHIRRSDGVTMGDSGLPDVIAVHPTRGLVLAWELKTQRGSATLDQAAWLAGFRQARTVDARIVWPADYDEALAVIVGAKR